MRVGDRARKVSEKSVSQIGSQRGNHATNRSELLTGDVEAVRLGLKPSGGPGGIPLGNELSAKCPAGPGGGRTLYGQAGTNKTYGTPYQGERGIQGEADRGQRAILGPPSKRS